MFFRIFSVLLAVLLLAGCCGDVPAVSTDFQTKPSIPAESVPVLETTIPTEPEPTFEPSSVPETTEESTVPPFSVHDYVNTMTLREKIGQLFLVTPEVIPIDASQPEDIDSFRSALEDDPVGGLVLFTEHLLSPEQVKTFCETVKDAGKISLFLAIDEEGGPVSRLAGHPDFDLPRYESAGAVGADGDPEKALEMGTSIGSYLHEYGFNLDFAPDADVNTNPDNPVIGSRAFSSDPQIAADLARAFADGLNGPGIIPTFKHFPGHGDTDPDSHAGIAVSRKTAEEMDACEWLPFRGARSDELIMVGHIAAPEVTGSEIPAAFSRQMVTDILKDQLGFSGLVVTDSLSMGAVTENDSSSEAALLALEAGCDLLLMPDDLDEALDGIQAAVENGDFPEARLDETVEKILNFKISRGIWIP